MSRLSAIAAALLALTLSSRAEPGDGFRPFGEYLIRTRLKVTGDHVVNVPIKPLRISVSTDGVSIRIATEGDSESGSVYKIYRSDGIGRQTSPGGGLEIIPGVQATCDSGGLHQHLRLTRETLTLTSFPGVSDQTVVTHAVAVTPTSTPAAAAGTGVAVEKKETSSPR